MDDQEIALRFMLFYNMVENYGNIDSYLGYMETSLDEFTEDHIKTKNRDLERYVSRFSNAMLNAEYLIGRKYSFRKITPKDLAPNAYKQLINKALFVCTSILLANYDHSKLKEMNAESSLLIPLADKIENDPDLFYYLSYGTNGRSNLLYTFHVLKELFENQIKY